MPRRPILLIHGYSDSGESFKTWQKLLAKELADDPPKIRICNYKSLTNEVTIKDLAEAFDRSLRLCANIPQDGEFDAIVHSTGMLVLRSWLSVDKKRQKRLKRLIGLAPATFGSPLAHKGRSLLGSIFKGSREWGPDFLEVGDMILDGLELGSKFTWDLAHADLIGRDTYGAGKDTPYVFTFCGTEGYTGPRALVNDPASDGTVRIAGCAMNSRKVKLDLTLDPTGEVIGEGGKRLDASKVPALEMPVYPIRELNHHTILAEPQRSPQLVALVTSAIRDVIDEVAFKKWSDTAKEATKTAWKGRGWQQFVVRAVDERDDPITDYNLEVQYRDDKGLFRGIREFKTDVHTYARDKSFRCFHVNLDELAGVADAGLKLRVIASSGSKLVLYHGHGTKAGVAVDEDADPRGDVAAELDISGLVKDHEMRFFYPFTTTLIELRLNREPVPIDRTREAEILRILEEGHAAST